MNFFDRQLYLNNLKIIFEEKKYMKKIAFQNINFN